MRITLCPRLEGRGSAYSHRDGRPVHRRPRDRAGLRGGRRCTTSHGRFAARRLGGAPSWSEHLLAGPAPRPRPRIHAAASRRSPGMGPVTTLEPDLHRSRPTCARARPRGLDDRPARRRRLRPCHPRRPGIAAGVRVTLSRAESRDLLPRDRDAAGPVAAGPPMLSRDDAGGRHATSVVVIRAAAPPRVDLADAGLRGRRMATLGRCCVADAEPIRAGRRDRREAAVAGVVVRPGQWRAARRTSSLRIVARRRRTALR